MAEQLPLPALLSQALVAFTIEFDNEFEHRMPHITTNHGATGPHGGLWLTSMVMWFNCMRFVGEEPMPVAELARRARTGTNLDGMRRWGYVVLESASGDPKHKPRDLTIRATRAGHRAQEVWRPLPGVIEDRWRERFGAPGIERLRASLWALAARAEAELPDCLPILGYGLFSGRRQTYPRRTPDTDQDAGPGPDQDAGPGPGPADQDKDAGPGLPLPVLMARVLLGYALRFERRSPLSLAICANVLRILDSAGVRVRDLPARSGVSKESIAMAMGILTKRDLVTVGTDKDAGPAGGRWKVARLTPRGQEAQWAYTDGIATVEQKSAERFGAGAIARLRADLEALAGDPADPAASPLMQGLEPYPDNWRADVRPPQTLPHYPMVLHRGGFPDGS